MSPYGQSWPTARSGPRRARVRAAGSKAPYLDAQGLGFVTAGNGAAVVVGQHDQRPALQPGLEDAFAGDVEVVAVDEGERVGCWALYKLPK